MRVVSRLVFVFLCAVALIACGTAPAIREPVARTLPAKPKFLAPVYVAPPKVGDDPIVVIDRYRRGLRRANNIILRGGRAWDNVAKRYVGAR